MWICSFWSYLGWSESETQGPCQGQLVIQGRGGALKGESWSSSSPWSEWTSWYLKIEVLSVESRLARRRRSDFRDNTVFRTYLSFHDTIFFIKNVPWLKSSFSKWTRDIQWGCVNLEMKRRHSVSVPFCALSVKWHPQQRSQPASCPLQAMLTRQDLHLLSWCTTYRTLSEYVLCSSALKLQQKILNRRPAWRRVQWSCFCGLRTWWSIFWLFWMRLLSWTWLVHTASPWMSSRRPQSGQSS